MRSLACWNSVPGSPPPERPVGLLLSEEAAARQQAGGTWTDIVFLRNLPNALTPVVWYIALQIVALAAVPTRVRIVPAAAGPRVPAGKTAWALAGRHRGMAVGELRSDGLQLQFGGRRDFDHGCAVGVGMGALRRGDRPVREAALAHVAGVRSVLFLVAFLAFLAVRLANPDLWHPVARRRKADGHRVPQRRHALYDDAPLRPLVRRRIPELLLLRPVHHREPPAPDRADSARGLQHRRTDVLCPDRHHCCVLR